MLQRGRVRLSHRKIARVPYSDAPTMAPVQTPVAARGHKHDQHGLRRAIGPKRRSGHRKHWSAPTEAAGDSLTARIRPRWRDR